jgi:CheY-like chemotaxis protein
MLISKRPRQPPRQQQLIYVGSPYFSVSFDLYRFGRVHSQIRFAAISEKPDLAVGSPLDSSKARFLKRKIMIVDDESQIAKLYSLILSNSGFTVSYLEYDGTYALKRLQNGAVIDLVIMDQRMPNMDGTTATKLLKEIKPDLKVIMVSAYEIPDAEKRMFDTVLTKPVSSKTLVDTAAAVLGA